VQNTAALAVALNEAAQPSFKEYAQSVVSNAKVLATHLMARGFDVVSGGTDNHLILVDLTNKNVTGKVAAKALDKAGLELNYNSVPYDTRKPFDPSGIRLGTPSVTSRGMGTTEMGQIADWIDRVIASPSDETSARVLAEVLEVTCRFPAPGILLKQDSK
jgi:glycine hydroxymethyltransferase